MARVRGMELGSLIDCKTMHHMMTRLVLQDFQRPEHVRFLDTAALGLQTFASLRSSARGRLPLAVPGKVGSRLHNLFPIWYHGSSCMEILGLGFLMSKTSD